MCAWNMWRARLPVPMKATARGLGRARCFAATTAAAPVRMFERYSASITATGRPLSSRASTPSANRPEMPNFTGLSP